MTPEIQTRTTYVDIFSPKPEMIDICDIAHALGYTCRFRGFTSRFYSVAQHSYNVSVMLGAFPVEVQLAGLLHDAAEAYMGDMPTPHKQRFQDFREVEGHLQACIFDKFGLPWPPPKGVEWADDVMLHVEANAFLPKPVWTRAEPQPVGIVMAPWGIADGAYVFLKRFHELQGRRT